MSFGHLGLQPIQTFGGGMRAPTAPISHSIPQGTTKSGVQLKDWVKYSMNEYRDKLASLKHISVQLSNLTEEEIIAKSSEDIVSDGVSGPGTVNSPALGSQTSDMTCGRCDMEDCPGHYGRLKFAKPIFNPLYINNGTIFKILQCICLECGKLLLTDGEVKSMRLEQYPPIERLNRLSDASKRRACHSVRGIPPNEVPTCSRSTRKYYIKESQKMGKIKVWTEIGPKKEFEEFSAEKILQVFKSSYMDASAKAMGYESSKVVQAFIMVSMLIPPLSTRPPVIIGGKTSNSELTNLLLEIARANVILRNFIASNGGQIQGTTAKGPGREKKYKGPASEVTLTTDLYKTVSNYQKFIDDMIRGKDALIRAMIMAKRSNFCARGVISPDDSLKFGELLIPEYMADYLTPQVDVTPDNIDELEALMAQGKIKHVIPRPGSNRSPWSYSPSGVKKTTMIEVGDVAERCLRDGDIVIAGRQPTIHKYNVMAYRVKIGYDRPTIGLYLAVTGALNADFDGDEMSIWLPQSEDALKEAFERMFVCRNIVSQSTNAPVVKATMDTVTSAFLMTDDSSEVPESIISATIPKLESMTQFVGSDTDDTITKVRDIKTFKQRLSMTGVAPTSGKAFFSSILPADFNYRNGDVTIVNGILINGRITSDHIGGAHRSIIQDLFVDYGWKRASEFINDLTIIARAYADYVNISVGYSDCDYGMSKYAMALKKIALSKAEADAASFGERRETATEEELREREILGVLNSVQGVSGKLAQLTMDDHNTVKDMSKRTGGGAKGDIGNTAQMGGIIGQQNVGGGRITADMDGGTRSLPYFRPGEESLKSRGFISSSFWGGLDLAEMFFNAIASRPALMDTPLKVSEVGDTHRMLCKAFEGIHSYADGSVRNYDGVIYQPIYGEDGCDSSQLMNVTVRGKTVASFIDLKSVATKINASYGFVPRTKATSKIKRNEDVDVVDRLYAPRPEDSTRYTVFQEPRYRQ